MSRKFEHALELYGAGEYGRAFSVLSEAARNGDTDAMSHIAFMYSHGEGVRLDYDKTLKWEMESWEGGNKEVAINIAITYRLKGDIVEYKKWLEQALKDGDGEAALLLAKLFLVSRKEHNRVRELLGLVIAHDPMHICEESIEEAHGLLTMING